MNADGGGFAVIIISREKHRKQAHMGIHGFEAAWQLDRNPSKQSYSPKRSKNPPIQTGKLGALIINGTGVLGYSILQA